MTQPDWQRIKLTYNGEQLAIGTYDRDTERRYSMTVFRSGVERCSCTPGSDDGCDHTDMLRHLWVEANRW